MQKTDDSFLTPEQYASVRKEANRALRKANAFGRFPTPVADILEAAKVEVSDGDELSEGFLRKLRRKAGAALKRAVSKVMGVLDARDGIVFIQRAVVVVKQTFLKLHEGGHAILPWQRKIYAVIEDCEKTLDPDIAELFDREANIFAAEVLFQVDRFIKEAEDYDFGIKVPLTLSKKYGASAYASIRQYVSKNSRTCAVLVLDPPELVEGDGFRAGLRRAIASQDFKKYFGDMSWPSYFTPDDKIGAMIPPNGKKMSWPREIVLKDLRGNMHECIAETFRHTFNIFILIHEVKTLTKKTILVHKGTIIDPGA